MAIEHKLVKSEFQSGNRKDLQYYVECSCGFQGRMGTEQASKDQFDNHLKYHNEESYFSKMVGEVEETKPEDNKSQGIRPLTPASSDWKPTGAV